MPTTSNGQGHVTPNPASKFFQLARGLLLDKSWRAAASEHPATRRHHQNARGCCTQGHRTRMSPLPPASWTRAPTAEYPVGQGTHTGGRKVPTHRSPGRGSLNPQNTGGQSQGPTSGECGWGWPALVGRMHSSHLQWVSQLTQGLSCPVVAPASPALVCWGTGRGPAG